MITFINSQGKKIHLEEDFILKVARSWECGCPEHLLKLIESTKELQRYEADCISTNPKGFPIHSWLLTESRQLETRITTLLADLLLKENILDENYNLNPDFKI